MQVRRYAVPSEQHDPEEGRFEEERRQHFVAEQRSDDIPGNHRELRPVRSELIGQHDARDDAHRERDGENFGPESRQPVETVFAGHPPAHEQRRDERRKSDREAREDDVKRYRKGELDARQQDGIDVHEQSILRRTRLWRHHAAIRSRRRGIHGSAVTPNSVALR